MDLFSIKTIKELLKQQEIRPRRGLGQNFLASKEVLVDILEAAQLKRSDTVLEIGPGIGTLTRELAQFAKKVIAVEKDQNLVEMLKGLTVGMKNIEIIHSDILKLDHSRIPTLQHSYKVVANLPYYITSPVIRMFLDPVEGRLQQPELMVLMVQKEVAQRICAKPPHMSLLAVSVQIYGKPSIVSYVKKTCFWPQPKVDSAIIKITPIAADINADARRFFTIVKAGFKQPRKQLLNNLVHGLGDTREKITRLLEKNGIQGTQRSETLSVQDWIKLAKDYTIYE